MRINNIFRIVGAVVALAGLINVPPLIISELRSEGNNAAYLESLAACLIVGGSMWYFFRSYREDLRLRDGFLVTSAVWIFTILACALPFVLAPPKLSYVDAVFEAASGLTTTGGTVITGLDHLPKSILFYRASLNFIGGMGIVILAVAILPMLRVGGSQLFRAESTGPVKDTRLTPRIAETAKALWMMYVGLNVICAMAYWAGGMSLFDAVCHAFGTLATGGFGNYDASFGFWNSPLIDFLATLFMALGGLNFSLHFIAWRRASLSTYHADAEVKAYFLIIAVVAFLVAMMTWRNGIFSNPLEALRHALFQTVSNITTTGFITTGFATWPGFAPLVLMLVGFVGGCAGSTGGGIKVVRVVLLFKQGLRELQQLVHPRGRFLVKFGRIPVPGSILAAIAGFVTLYIFSFLLMSLLVMATGVEMITAISSVATCINNMGPALGEAASHFASLNDTAVWILSFAMILGRLEIFTLLVLFTPAFWRE